VRPTVKRSHFKTDRPVQPTGWKVRFLRRSLIVLEFASTGSTAERDVPEDLVRGSVGCEHVDDLWTDLDEALRATRSESARDAGRYQRQRPVLKARAVPLPAARFGSYTGSAPASARSR
jgi:hypothetical protein